MFLHSTCGIVVDSDICLSAAAKAPKGSVRGLRIRRAAELAAPERWVREYAIPGEPSWGALGRVADGYFLRCHGQADFWIDASGGEIRYAASPGSTDLTVEQLLLDQVIPRLLQLHGRPAIHGSAVAQGSDVIAFVGPSGTGKSTLAGSFRGSRELVCDDCVALAGGDAPPRVIPSYASVRLWDDAANALTGDAGPLPLASDRVPKRRMEMRQAGGELVLRRVYILEAGSGAPVIRRLRGADALMALVPHLHRLDPDSPALQARELELLGRLVDVVPIASLGYARSFEELPLVHAAVERDAATAPVTPRGR